MDVFPTKCRSQVQTVKDWQGVGAGGGAEQGQRSWRTSHEALEHHPDLHSPNAIWPVLNFGLYSKVLVPQRATGIIRQSTGWRSDQNLKRNESVTIRRQEAEFSAWHSSSPSSQCPESPASASLQEGSLSPQRNSSFWDRSHFAPSCSSLLYPQLPSS